MKSKKNNTRHASLCTDQRLGIVARLRYHWSRIRHRVRSSQTTIDDQGRFFFYWSMVVSAACLYNIVVIPMVVFEDFYSTHYTQLLMANVATDLINLIDIVCQMLRVRIKHILKTPKENLVMYVKSFTFAADALSVTPTDALATLFFGRSDFASEVYALARLDRLLKTHRLTECIARAEVRSNFPHFVRLFRLALLCYLIFHWNCCVYFLISIVYDYRESKLDDWTFSFEKIPDIRYAKCDTRFAQHTCLFNETRRNARRRDDYLAELVAFWDERRFNTTNFAVWRKQYEQSFYWSALTLVKLGEQPWPDNNFESAFEVFDTLLGLMIFAIILGDIGQMVSQMNYAKMRYEEFIDNCKRYMNFRKVDKFLEDRVINWFEYYWQEGHAKVDENEIKNQLPRCLMKDLAAEIHLETLRKVKLFKDCEPELLHEIIANLQFRIFSPGDFVCHRGDIGKELYVIKRGELEVINPTTNEICATLGEGAVFGELSLLKIVGNKNGNRRTASIRAIGFVDLYVLQKRDLWMSIHDHPNAKSFLTEKGKEILRRENLLDESRQAEESDLEEDWTLELTEEERLESIRKRLARISKQVDQFEKHFIETSSSLKRSITCAETEYRRQRRIFKRQTIRKSLNIPRLCIH